MSGARALASAARPGACGSTTILSAAYVSWDLDALLAEMQTGSPAYICVFSIHFSAPSDTDSSPFSVLLCQRSLDPFSRALHVISDSRGPTSFKSWGRRGCRAARPTNNTINKMAGVASAPTHRPASRTSELLTTCTTCAVPGAQGHPSLQWCQLGAPVYLTPDAIPESGLCRRVRRRATEVAALLAFAAVSTTSFIATGTSHAGAGARTRERAGDIAVLAVRGGLRLGEGAPRWVEAGPQLEDRVKMLLVVLAARRLADLPRAQPELREDTQDCSRAGPQDALDARIRGSTN
ncbi:hypothetical protein FA95DRAFT_1562839 [Auriscalpium vulgare]|uniref:Uncharacterized protein n=1 Tax=Auriscalpium vulgare TaxID=40419 RepID=A0ACB8RJC4_9AGAM|nr:hypothetical protein FA95DRAFT_1562839 [Auriscalpium vulgare]